MMCLDSGNKDVVVRPDRIDLKLVAHDKRFDDLVDQLRQERESGDQRFRQERESGDQRFHQERESGDQLFHQERESADQRFRQMLADARTETKDLLKSFREDSDRARELYQRRFDSILASCNELKGETLSYNSSNLRELRSLSETVTESQIYETRHFETTQNRFDNLQVEQ